IAAKGITHKILILPSVERIPLATYNKIADFKGTVIFTKRLPAKAPGFDTWQDETKSIQAISAKYKLIDEAKLADALHAAVPRDWSLPPEIGVVHRKLPYADVYFVANTSNHAVKFDAWTNAAWWDPTTGKDSDPHGVLAPYESRIVVLGGPAERREAAKAERTVAEIGGWEPWPQNYSGTRTYEKTVRLASTPAHLWLDFGDGAVVDPNAGRRPANGMRALLESPVREAAQVWVN